MTLPDNAAPRKPRRLGLIIPWAMAAMLAIVWSGGWFWLKAETELKMDAARAQAAQAGWRLDWTSRKVSGFPFRLNVDLTNARWGEASGWSVTAPVLNAQAYVSRTDSWMMVAPEGVVVARPVVGPVVVNADVLRGSVSELGSWPPRVSVEAMGLHFVGRPGSLPFQPSSAKELHLHVRGGPSDQGAFYLEVDHAIGESGTKPETSILDAIFSRASAMHGRTVSSAWQSWRTSGGTFDVRQAVGSSGALVADLLMIRGWEKHALPQPSTGPTR